jgi:hypothetical protein
MLLAIGLSALLWTGAVRQGSARPSDFVTMSGVGLHLVAGDPHAPGDSDHHWRAQQPTIAAANASLWKSPLVHAALAATRPARAFATAPAVSSPDPPVRSASAYLRHTPLLI